MSYEFETVQSPKDTQWRWRLVAENGKVVGDGSEGYVSQSNVDRAVDSIVREFQRRTLASDEFFVLRKEHWEAIRQRALSAGEAELVRLIEEAAL